MSRIQKKEKNWTSLKRQYSHFVRNVNQYLEKDNGMIESILKIIKTFYAGYVTSQ